MPNWRPSLERAEGSDLRNLRGLLDSSGFKDISTVEVALRNLRHGAFDGAHRLDAFDQSPQYARESPPPGSKDTEGKSTPSILTISGAVTLKRSRGAG